MGIFFLALALGGFFYSVTGAVLSWDGAYVFYDIISKGEPFIIQSRYFTVPVHFVAIFASGLTDNIFVIYLVFSAFYVSVPLFTTYLSWRIIRDERPDLFIWCAISTGLVLILGQMLFVFEAIPILHFFWPIWFAILLGAKKNWHLAVIIVLVVTMPFFHAYAIGLIGYAILAWAAYHYRHNLLKSRRFWIVSAIMAASLMAAIFILLFEEDPFVQTQSLSVRNVASAFYRLNILGIINLVLVGVLTVAIYKQSVTLRKSDRITPSYLPRAIIGIIILCGVLLAFWAGNVHAWWNELTYRTMAPFVLTVIYFVAFWQSVQWENAEISQNLQEWRLHRPAIMLMGMIFAVVALIQGLGWMDISNRVEDAVEQQAAACVSLDIVDETVGQTALDHWSVTPYYLLRQGQTPEYILLDSENCSQDVLDQGIYVTEWEPYYWGDDIEWFNFDELKSSLTD